MSDPGRYRVDTAVSRGLDAIAHLDGLPWWKAPNPKPRHKCWVQTKGLIRSELIFRCACGAIAFDSPKYWMQKNANINPHHTIYSGDYYPPLRSRLARLFRRSS